MDNNQMFNDNNQQPEVYAPMDAQQPVEAAPQFDAQAQYNAAPQYDTQAQYNAAPQFDAQPQYTQPQYAQPQYAQPQYAAQPAKKSNKIGFAIASLVLGIISILTCCCCEIGALFGIPGIILGGIAISKKYDGKGMAIAGVICSVIGIVICIVYWVLFCCGALDSYNSYNSYLNDFYNYY